MFPNLLFTMSLSGSMVFILYILTYPLAKKYFSLKWRYRVLKIAAAFYLVPIPACKYLIMDVIHNFSPKLWVKISHISGTADWKYIIIISPDFVKFSSGVRHMLIVLLFFGTVSFVIIQKQIIQYWKWITICGFASEKPTNCEQELFSKVKKEIGVKKNVKLVCSEYCRSPMITGVVSSILIFPIWRDSMKTDKYEYMLRHELVHIKHHDLLIKYIGLLVMAVHWYNPFVYIMFREVAVMSEMYCDSIVICGKEEDERRKYSDLILKLATQNEYAGKKKYVVGLANGRNKNVYKRRILEMKRDKKYKVVLSVIMTAFICMAGGITALAYDSPSIVLDDLGHDFDKDADFTIELAETEQVKLPSDYCFIDDSGNVYDISNSDINNRRICFHDFSIHGTVNVHKKDGKGGCVVKSYEALLCTVCSDVKVGELKSTVTYKPCPH